MTKIFGIGFQKTGTVSFAKALRTLGYRVCDARYDMIDAVKEKNLAPVFALADRFDAVRDNPWPLVFRKLDARYPGSKFVLTIRDDTRWIKSVVNHLGVAPDRMQQLVYGRGAPGGYEEVFLERYRRHNAEVQAHFKDRPSDLLVVDWEKGQGWGELCGLVGREIPNLPFPHANRRSYDGLLSRFKFAAANAVRLGRRVAGT